MIYIYILKDPLSGDVKYCGKTNNIKVRLAGHLKDRRYNKEKYQWIFDIKSKGLKPILEVIDIVDDDNWDFWEKYWISQLKTWGFNLFNKTDGGEYSVTGFKHTDETKKKISELQLGRILNDEWRKNISLGRIGIKFSDKHRENISKSISKLYNDNEYYRYSLSNRVNFLISTDINYRKKISDSHKNFIPNNNKRIFQIDINTGDILNEFNSITDAYKKLGLNFKNSSLISSACNGKVKVAYGYYWCYVDKYDNFIFEEYNRVYNPILQFDKNGIFIKEYSNIKNAAIENNLNQSQISHALNEDPSCGGFIWFHKDKYDDNILKDKINRIKKEYILYQLDLNTNEIINKFNSIKEAEEKTKIKHISLVLSGKRKKAGGYKWKKE